MSDSKYVKIYKEILSYVLIFTSTFFILHSVMGMAYIPSGSMEPTLSVGRKYPYITVAYLFNGPKRGDIIVFDDHGVAYCKRIIGLPGETVSFDGGFVYINGERLDEPYVAGFTYPYLANEYTVPEGEYLFLGDNRENSKDSRLWEYSFLKKSQILGKIVLTKPIF